MGSLLSTVPKGAREAIATVVRTIFAQSDHATAMTQLRKIADGLRLLAAAAAYQRLDLMTFVLRTALPVAEEVIARHERIRLSARDGARVLELLENPPKPTPALRTAARRLRRHRG